MSSSNRASSSSTPFSLSIPSLIGGSSSSLSKEVKKQPTTRRRHSSPPLSLVAADPSSFIKLEQPLSERRVTAPSERRVTGRRSRNKLNKKCAGDGDFTMATESVSPPRSTNIATAAVAPAPAPPPADDDDDEAWSKYRSRKATFKFSKSKDTTIPIHEAEPEAETSPIGTPIHDDDDDVTWSNYRSEGRVRGRPGRKTFKNKGVSDGEFTMAAESVSPSKEIKKKPTTRRRHSLPPLSLHVGGDSISFTDLETPISATAVAATTAAPPAAADDDGVTWSDYRSRKADFKFSKSKDTTIPIHEAEPEAETSPIGTPQNSNDDYFKRSAGDAYTDSEVGDNYVTLGRVYHRKLFQLPCAKGLVEAFAAGVRANVLNQLREISNKEPTVEVLYEIADSIDLLALMGASDSFLHGICRDARSAAGQYEEGLELVKSGQQSLRNLLADIADALLK